MDFLREQGWTVVQLDVEDKGLLAKTLLVKNELLFPQEPLVMCLFRKEKTATL